MTQFLSGPAINVMIRRNYIYEDAFEKLSKDNGKIISQGHMATLYIDGLLWSKLWNLLFYGAFQCTSTLNQQMFFGSF